MTQATNVLTPLIPKLIARGHMQLRKKLLMPRLVNQDYKMEAAKKSDVINVSIPPIKTAQDVTPSHIPPQASDTIIENVQVSLDYHKHSDFELSDVEIGKLEKDENFVPMGLNSAIDAIAQAANISIWNTYKGVYGYAGTAGTTPFASDFVVATDVKKILSQQLCPPDQRRFVLDFAAEAKATNLAPFRDTSQSGDKGVITEGEIGRKIGMDWYSDDDVPTHTAGTITTGLISKAATAYAVGVKTIVATTAASTGACALKEGDIILFAGDTQTYVLTADATQASAATDVTLTFFPGLKVAHVGSEAITVKASHVVNLAFHQQAITFATRPLSDGALERAAGIASMTLPDPKTGLILRLELLRQYKKWVWDVDMLWGTKLVRPELACRLAG